MLYRDLINIVYFSWKIEIFLSFNSINLIFEWFWTQLCSPKYLGNKNLQVFSAVECHTPGSVHFAPAKSGIRTPDRLLYILYFYHLATVMFKIFTESAPRPIQSISDNMHVVVAIFFPTGRNRKRMDWRPLVKDHINKVKNPETFFWNLSMISNV